MATTPAIPDPAQTGVPAEPQAQPATPQIPESPAAAPQMFEKTDAGEGKIQVRLNTGETFIGTPDELVEKLAGSAAHTHVYGRQLKQQLQQFQQQTPAQQPSTPQAAPIDPAEELIANITAKSLGFQNAAAMRAAVETLAQGQQEMQGRMVAHQFMAENPDFAPSDHNSRVLTDLLAQNGVPETPQTLAMAHNWAKAQRLYEQVSVQPAGQPWSRPQAPPTVPNGLPSSAAPAATEQDLWKMPMDQMQALMGRR